jgi:hypothetical protein
MEFNSAFKVLITKLYVYEQMDFFLFNAPSGTSDEDLCTFYVSIKNLISNAQHLYRADCDMWLNCTLRKQCCVCVATMVMRTRHNVT